VTISFSNNVLHHGVKSRKVEPGEGSCTIPTDCQELWLVRSEVNANGPELWLVEMLWTKLWRSAISNGHPSKSDRNKCCCHWHVFWDGHTSKYQPRHKKTAIFSEKSVIFTIYT